MVSVSGKKIVCTVHTFMHVHALNALRSRNQLERAVLYVCVPNDIVKVLTFHITSHANHHFNGNELHARNSQYVRHYVYFKWVSVCV